MHILDLTLVSKLYIINEPIKTFRFRYHRIAWQYFFNQIIESESNNEKIKPK